MNSYGYSLQALYKKWQRGVDNLRRYLLQRFGKNEKGVAAVEFALIAPILVLLVLGIIEFGWLFNGWITINGAAREGARIATVLRVFEDNYTEEGGSWQGYIEEAVKEHATPFFSESDVSSTASLSDNDSRITVRARGEMQPLIGFFVSGPQSLQGEAIMRVE